MSELTQLNSTIAQRKQSNKLVQLLKRRIFIVNWIQEYDRTKFIADLIAGFTIGLMIIPQSLAYANLAELPSQVTTEYLYSKLFLIILTNLFFNIVWIVFSIYGIYCVCILWNCKRSQHWNIVFDGNINFTIYNWKANRVCNTVDVSLWMYGTADGNL